MLAATDGVREVHRGETSVPSPPLGRAPLAFRLTRLVDCRSSLSSRLGYRGFGLALRNARLVRGGTLGISCRRKPLGFHTSLLQPLRVRLPHLRKALRSSASRCLGFLMPSCETRVELASSCVRRLPSEVPGNLPNHGVVSTQNGGEECIQ